MPKMKCTCNNILNLSSIPCEIQYKFISDKNYDNYIGKIDAEELYITMKSFIKCPNCGRLWIFWDGFDKPPQEYLPIKQDT